MGLEEMSDTLEGEKAKYKTMKKQKAKRMKKMKKRAKKKASKESKEKHEDSKESEDKNGNIINYHQPLHHKLANKHHTEMTDEERFEMAMIKLAKMEQHKHGKHHHHKKQK